MLWREPASHLPSARKETVSSGRERQIFHRVVGIQRAEDLGEDLEGLAEDGSMALPGPADRDVDPSKPLERYGWGGIAW